MKAFATVLLLFLFDAQVAGAAAKLDVAYASVERILSLKILTEAGRYYLQGGPDDTCA